MRQDRFLIGILIGIAVIALAAVGLFLVRRGNMDYSSAETPAGVTRNYILAIQKGDYERAWAYLAEGKNKPDTVTFRQAYVLRQQDPLSVSVLIGEPVIEGSKAMIPLTLVHQTNAPFESSFRETNRVDLIQDAGGTWKITQMPYPFWSYDWYQPTPDPQKLP